jgi:hypothetical protein
LRQHRRVATAGERCANAVEIGTQQPDVDHRA